MFGLSERMIADVNAVFAKFCSVEKVLIFGSRAEGSSHLGSDVDLALFGKSLQRKDMLQISEELNEETDLPYFFDLLLYDSLENQELQEHIMRVGKVFMRENR